MRVSIALLFPLVWLYFMNSNVSYYLPIGRNKLSVIYKTLFCDSNFERPLWEVIEDTRRYKYGLENNHLDVIVFSKQYEQI